MHVVNIDKTVALLQQRKKLLMMQLSANDIPEKGQVIEAKIEGNSFEFPVESLNVALRDAIKVQLAANAEALKEQGCIIKE